jgi:membrane-bound lytic murein transglycosylase B
MIRRLLFTLAVAVAIGIGVAGNARSQAEFDTWLVDLRAEASDAGISQATLDAALVGIAPIPRIIELDRSQPEGRLTAAQYLARVVPRSRIDAARSRLTQHRALLEAVARDYRVQPRFIVALWGIETDFGRNTGGFGVVESLATLAYDGRRSAFFRTELLNALEIIDDGHIAAHDMTGSWAGAMGQSQFMPSSFLSYAVDRNGDGRRDIWTTLDDVFASIANYLASVGWKDDQTWGRAVRLPNGFDESQLGLETVRPISGWQARGVRRSDGTNLPARDLPASIVQPDGSGTRAYMVYDNFRTTLKWNRSTYFALAVGHLADGMVGP